MRMISEETKILFYAHLKQALTICLKVHRHQFIGSQVIKLFAAKDDEVRIARASALWVIPCWW